MVVKNDQTFRFLLILLATVKFSRSDNIVNATAEVKGIFSELITILKSNQSHLKQKICSSSKYE